MTSVVCFVLIDSIYLASGSSDLSIRLWNIINGVCLKVLKGHTGCINALIEWRPMNTASFNNNNTLWNSKLISASSDKAIRVWNIDYGTEKILNGHTANVLALVFVSANMLASGSGDKTIRVWDLNSFNTIIILKGIELLKN